MTSYTFTPAEDANPELLAAYQARLAKLKPACSRCGHTLGKRDLELGRCSNRRDCLLRQTFAGERFPDGKALNIGEVHALERFRSSTPAARNGRHNEGGIMPSSPVKETARMVAVDLLRKKGGGPIKVGELAKLVVASGRTSLTGKTPEATVSAHIYTAAKKGELFRKTDRGEVALLEATVPAAKRGRGAAKKEPAAKKEAAPRKRQPKKESGRARRSKVVPTDDVARQDAIARGDELPEPTPADGERPSEAAMRMADEELAAEAAAAVAKQKEEPAVA